MARFVIDFRLPMDKGMLPFREFPAISKSVKSGITSPMSRGIGPENKLSLSYSALTLEDQSGKGPSKRFELRSTVDVLVRHLSA